MSLTSFGSTICMNLFDQDQNDIVGVRLGHEIKIRRNENKSIEFKNSLISHSPDRMFHIEYVNGSKVLMNSLGQEIYKLGTGDIRYGFTSDNQHLIYQINNERYLLRFNLKKLKAEPALKLPLGLKLIRVIDSNTFVAQQFKSDYGLISGPFEYPSHYNIVKIVPGLFYGENLQTTQLISDTDRMESGISFVVVNDLKTHAAVFWGHKDQNNYNSRLNQFFKFKVFRLVDGLVVFDDAAVKKRLGSYEWQSHMTGTGLDQVSFRGDQLVLSGFQRTTGHTIINVREREIKIFNASTHDWPERLAQINIDDQRKLTIKIKLKGLVHRLEAQLEGFESIGWGLQEKFEYSLVNADRALILTQNNLFVAAFDLISGTALTYEQAWRLPGFENTLIYLVK